MEEETRAESVDKNGAPHSSAQEGGGDRIIDSSQKPSTNSSTESNDPVITTDEDEDEEVDLSCGIWRFRTNIFGKWFANLYVFAVCVGIASLFTAMVSEIVQVQLTSLERQFNIDNARAGLFDTAFKSGYLCAILLAGHFTKKAHIPILVGLSGVIQGFILLVPPILQFVDPYELPILASTDNSSDGGENFKYICHPLEANQSDSNSTTPTKDVNRLAYNVLIVLQVTKGVTDVFHAGFLPAIYMDDNLIDKSRMGILLGIQSVFQMLAGPLGREINGVISDIPIDLKETDIDPKDRRFVAAWWLGFLIFGIGTAVFSIPVMLFPRRLVSKRQTKTAEAKAVVTFAGGHVDEDVEVEAPEEATHEGSSRRVSAVSTEPNPDIQKQANTSTELSHSTKRKQSVSSHGKSSRRRSSLFPQLVGPTERKVSMTGDIVFDQPIKEVPDKEDEEKEDSSNLELLKDFPRALYRMFRKPIFILLVVDVVLASVPFGGTAFFRSSYMANEYNVPMSRVAFLSGITVAVGNTGGAVISSWLSSKVTTKSGYVLIIFCTYLVATCLTPLYLVFGCDNESVYGAPGDIGIQVNTSGVCSCDHVGQLLSCGSDGNNYFSPCHAGCSDFQGNVFTNCSLLSNHTEAANTSPGLCATDCDRNFLIYVFVHGLQNLVTASSIIAYKLLVLRSVEPRDRGLSISVYIFFFILLGIPAPNLFGRVVDGACYISDGEYCVLYNRDTIRYMMSGIDVAMHGSSQLTSLMMLIYFTWEQRQMKMKAKKDDAETAAAALGATEANVEASDPENPAANGVNIQSTAL